MKLNKIFTLFLYFSAVILQQNLICMKIPGKLIVVSIPKSGSHLMQNLLLELAKMSQVGGNFSIVQSEIDKMTHDKFYITHRPYAEREHSLLISNNFTRGILMVRDPRDHILSLADWVKKYPNFWPWGYKFEKDELILHLINKHSAALFGSPANTIPQNVRFSHDLYLKWSKVQQPAFYLATFEKLVGPKGGGSKPEQIKEIINIARHIGITVSVRQAMQIGDKIFGNSATFRNGKIGAWRKEFKPHHIKAMKEACGSLIEEMGYSW